MIKVIRAERANIRVLLGIVDMTPKQEVQSCFMAVGLKCILPFSKQTFEAVAHATEPLYANN